MATDEQRNDQEEPPPFGGSWNRIYGAVVVYTLVLIAALYWLTVALDR